MAHDKPSTSLREIIQKFRSKYGELEHIVPWDDFVAGRFKGLDLDKLRSIIEDLSFYYIKIKILMEKVIKEVSNLPGIKDHQKVYFKDVIERRQKTIDALILWRIISFTRFPTPYFQDSEEHVLDIDRHLEWSLSEETLKAFLSRGSSMTKREEEKALIKALSSKDSSMTKREEKSLTNWFLRAIALQLARIYDLHCNIEDEEDEDIDNKFPSVRQGELWGGIERELRSLAKNKDKKWNDTQWMWKLFDLYMALDSYWKSWRTEDEGVRHNRSKISIAIQRALEDLESEVINGYADPDGDLGLRGDLQIALDLVNSKIFRIDLWYENSQRIRPVLSGKHPSIEKSLRMRLDDLRESFILGQYLSCTAMARSVLEYALRTWASKNFQDTQQDTKLERLINLVADHVPNLQRKDLHFIRANGNAIMHPEGVGRDNVVEFPPNRDTCELSFRIIINTIEILHLHN